MKLKKQCLRAVSGALAASVMAAMILTSCGGTTPPASSSNPASSSTSTSQPSSSSSSSSSSASSKPDPNKVKWTYMENGEKTATLTGYDSTCKEPDRVLTLPSQIDGYTVTRIMVRAFAYEKFREVTIPECVKEIDEFVFENNTNLEKVTILGAKTIEMGTFDGCSNLESVYLNDEITRIGVSAFDGCYKLKTINMPAKLNSIGSYALRGIKLEGQLVIPENVTYIGDEAFANTEITDIVIPVKAQKIGEGAFRNTKLLQVTLPEGITEIESYTFAYCRQLEKIYIPASVKYIDSNAFSNCGNLEIYYGGSEAAWKQIDIATGNDKLSSAEKHYNAKPTDLHF